MGVDLFMERGYPPFTMGGEGEGEGKEEKGKIKADPVDSHHFRTLSIFHRTEQIQVLSIRLGCYDDSSQSPSLPRPTLPQYFFGFLRQRHRECIRTAGGKEGFWGVLAPPPSHPLFFLSKTRHGG